MPSSENLQLVVGGAPSPQPDPLGIAPAPLPQLTRRAGDHLELYEFPRGAVLAPIRRAARDRGFDTETALALVVERELAATEIEARFGSAILSVLDERSAATAVRVGLCSAHSSYLQHLLGRSPVASSERPLRSPRAALPLRLVDRLSGKDFLFREDPDRLLAAAIQWEIAAVTSSETIGEWAYRTVALELSA
jgi:hypothetical protein